MKYVYGNSVKEALANKPVEIESAKVLEAYKEVYNVVIPACDVVTDHFYTLVWKEKGSNTELYETYYDIDDVRADYKFMTEENPDDYEYVVMQEVTEDYYDGEVIEILNSWNWE